MSWFSNYLFGDYSDESVVPDSYEGTAISDSFEKPVSSNLRETEVVSGIRYRDNTVQLDLNTPVEDPYAQQGYSNFGYGGDYSFVQQECYPNDSYGCHQSYSNFGYGGEQSFVQQECYPTQSYGCEQSFEHQVYSNVGDDGEPEDASVDEEGCYPVTFSFDTTQTFSSRKEMVRWVQDTAKDNGYLIVTKRSNKRGENYKIWFQCTFGGEHKSVATQRKTGSKKIGCPFEMIGFSESSGSVWRIEVTKAKHNHTPIENFEGHAYARRLSSEDKKLVKELAEQDIRNQSIWRTLTKNNPARKLIPKDIHNAVQKINAEKNVGNSPMQKLENILIEKNYTYYMRTNEISNEVEDVFFVHEKSFIMWCAFPHVLMIDATYKTNMYNLPFVQVVGMTSTNKSFTAACAVISAEKSENYLWVLQRIKSMLAGCMEPRVILTDRDFALMNACEQVFPKAHKYLCRFHIQQNINKNSKRKFSDKEWKEFVRTFWTLCESTTEEIYMYNLENFEAQLKEADREQVYDYMKKSWLDPYREKFVSCWINQTINFRQTTTNRVESMHATLKSHFPSHRNTLDKLVLYVDHVVAKQYTEIRNTFETSLRKVMTHHKNQPMLAYILRKVSIYAIELLSMELKRKEDGLRAYGASCGCQLFTSCGLPCACRLEKLENKGQEIRITHIDVFWKKLDFKPARNKIEDIDVDAEFEKLKKQIDPTPPQVKRSFFEKFQQILNPGNSNKKPPAVLKKTRGRPTLKMQEERKAEAARQSSYIPSEETWVDASDDLPRHSSYISAEDSCRGKNTKPLNLHPDFPNIKLGPKTDIAIRNYASQIPNVIHPYIVKIKDVKPDGHCGFRSVAVGLGLKQNSYLKIREQLLKELRMHESLWRQVFDPENVGHYDELVKRIDFNGVGRADIENYMTMPETGFLIAQRYGVIVHTFDIRGSDTIFPMLGGPNEADEPHLVVAVVFVDKGHFIHVELGGSYPMPPPNLLWTANRTERAAGWHTLYRDQIDTYEMLTYRAPDLNATPYVHDVS
ncbi:putative transcription factor FAR family [Helianthus annuus]|nr:putative transcription factor FAR family [Helianthus annuus]KAJ0505506.1 putative transcription factor FAR family [Helianthus annuus]KAJ0675173.1 putative transcription factor FAR family [Helianthus annuus]KAJ0862930.1 putative transcription factor FAR family [Helianthus annuus]KAJ0866769.1 putative transcription factor FAR family [Helianthus annuus]